MTTILSFILMLMRRQFWFVAILCTIFSAGLLWNEGPSITTVLITIALASIIALWAVLLRFWTLIFKSLMASGRSRHAE
jgi:hypothetical protein